VTIPDLCSLCPDVSVMTIHRDLDVLAKDGHVMKIRGGARAIDASMESRFDERQQENHAAKLAIAKKVVGMLSPGASVFMDAGTTNLIVAQNMPDIDMHIFTVGPNIALELLHVQKPSITVCGGNLHRQHIMVDGYSTLDMLKKINFDIALMGASGFSPECGFTCGVESQMMVKQLAIQRARKVFVLMDHSKLNHTLPFTFGRLEDVDYLVTDQELPPDILSAVAQCGVTVL